MYSCVIIDHSLSTQREDSYFTLDLSDLNENYFWFSAFNLYSDSHFLTVL